MCVGLDGWEVETNSTFFEGHKDQGKKEDRKF